jgi:hypothetical protein
MYWGSNQVDLCLSTLVQQGDPSVAADFLSNALPQLKKILTLDFAIALLPTAKLLLSQRYDQQLIIPYVFFALESNIAL